MNIFLTRTKRLRAFMATLAPRRIHLSLCSKKKSMKEVLECGTPQCIAGWAWTRPGFHRWCKANDMEIGLDALYEYYGVERKRKTQGIYRQPYEGLFAPTHMGEPPSKKGALARLDKRIKELAA